MKTATVAVVLLQLVTAIIAAPLSKYILPGRQGQNYCGIDFLTKVLML